jgi:hypothetical protein
MAAKSMLLQWYLFSATSLVYTKKKSLLPKYVEIYIMLPALGDKTTL